MSQPAAEERRGHSRERRRRHGAFGLTLDVDAPIAIPGLGDSEASGEGDTPTRIELDPRELVRRWERARGARGGWARWARSSTRT